MKIIYSRLQVHKKAANSALRRERRRQNDHARTTIALLTHALAKPDQDDAADPAGTAPPLHRRAHRLIAHRRLHAAVTAQVAHLGQAHLPSKALMALLKRQNNTRSRVSFTQADGRPTSSPAEAAGHAAAFYADLYATPAHPGTPLNKQLSAQYTL